MANHETDTEWYLPGSSDHKRRRHRKRSGHRYHHSRGSSRHHSRRGGRIWLRVVAVLLVVLAVTCGITGAVLYRSATTVESKAKAVMAQADGLESSLLAGNADELRTTAVAVNDGVHEIYNEVHGPLWTFASHIPVVGHDVANVQSLSASAYDLTQNALVPFADGVAGVAFDDLVQERSVNTAMLGAVRNTVVSISPVVVRNIDALSALTPGSIARVNKLINDLKTPLEGARVVFNDADHLFSILLGMLGDGGQTRSYAIVAQTNSEIRAGGGFPGQVGIVHVTDGAATLEKFVAVSDTQRIVWENSFSMPIDESELVAFEVALGNDAAACTLTPDFVRSGQLIKGFWGNAYGVDVDGVIAMDPVFLQRMLGLVGGITASDGTVVDGTNAAYELLNNVYWRYGYDDAGAKLEDEFFNDVAHEAFSRLLDAMGDFDMDAFGKLWSTLQASGEDHRFLVWMADDSEERLIRDCGFSGALTDDPEHPELGVYVNDNTWAKLCWYLDVWADVDDGIRNEDGTATYQVTAHFKNNITPEEAEAAPKYITGGNPWKRSVSDLMETVVIMAPAGAAINNVQAHQDTPIPDDKIIIDKPYYAECMLYGRDTRVQHINIEAEGETTVSFEVTMPAGANVKPVVRTSPLCHE